jgi:hypothetical protein
VAAGLGDHQRPGAHVPGVGGVPFDEGVDAPGRHVGEAQGRGPDAAHGPAPATERHHAPAEGGDLVRVVRLDARAHERPAERLGPRHGQALAS